ncbi:hypothetical protein BDW75DRAFT_242311 [Aspergillus navahoensis]
MDELHAKLYCKTESIDDGERHEILKDLAYICLCWRHSKDQYLKAAVHQWADELQSLANNSFLDEPATTPLNSGRRITYLEFKPYHEQNVEEEPTIAGAQHVMAKNLKMTQQLLQKAIKDPSSKTNFDDSTYLYLFGYAGAPGVYKVGSTKYIRRLAREHELCYPGLVIYCFNHCPNAELFEKLVHGEFSQCQRKHTCEACKTKPVEHKEWFEVPLEELVKCINEWSLFSRLLYCDDFQAREAELHFKIQISDLPKDPAMLRKWAMDKVDQWSGKTSRCQVEGPNGSVAARRIKPGNYAETSDVSDYPLSPVPELSPGSSAPGTPDYLLDPPTPTPGSRIRKGRYTSLQSEAIVEASPTDSIDSFFTPTGVDDDSQITLVESIHPNAKSKDAFRDSMPGAFHSESTTEVGTPRASVDNTEVDMPSTPTPVMGGKGSALAGARPQTRPSPADSSPQDTKEPDTRGLADMVRRLLFK